MLGLFYRILAINRQLPANRQIRVIAMQVGWNKGQRLRRDYGGLQRGQGCRTIVVPSSLAAVHGFKFNGLGRSPLADPNKFESYEPGLFWADTFRPDDPLHVKFYSTSCLFRWTQGLWPASPVPMSICSVARAVVVGPFRTLRAFTSWL